MKKTILFIPALASCLMLWSGCTTVVKEPATSSTTTHTESSVTRTPVETSTTTTRTGGY